MDLQHIREIIELMLEKDVAELELEQHGMHLRIRRPERGVAVAAPAAMPVVEAAAPVAPTADVAAGDARPDFGDAQLVRSPMVGTFYAAPEPGADPFVQVGDTVEEGQTLCIVEAMKLMNEIAADTAGEVVAVLHENGQPVEYGQELFAIKPS